MAGSRQRTLLGALLAIATLLVYSRSASNGFVSYDDPTYVFQNDVVTRGLTLDGVLWAFRSTAASNWHPATWLSHMLDVQLFGLDPRGHHLMSVGLHAASAVLLFLLLVQMTAAPWRSVTVAALFALHPLHVESVAWVAERKDVLSGLLWHLSLLSYVAYARKPSVASYLTTFVSFAVGLLAKPMVVTLPVVMLLLDWWPLARWRGGAAEDRTAEPPTRWTRLVAEKVPFLALSAVSSAVTLYAQHRGGALATLSSVPFGLRLANAVAAIGGYFGKSVWPHDLAVLYPFADPVDLRNVILGIAVLLAIAISVATFGRRLQYLVTGGLWFVVALLPVLGLIQVGAQSMADRYTYLPLTGLFIAVVWGGADLLSALRCHRRIVAATTAAILGTFAIGTWVQLAYWKDSLTLYRRAIDVTRGNFLMVNNYGDFLDQSGRHEEAIRVFEHAIVAESAGASPYFYLLLNTYASALNNAGRPEVAMEALQRAIALKPSYAKSYYSLGRILHVRFGDRPRAAEQYERAIAADPDFLDAYINLGGALNGMGRYDRALGVLERARSLARTERAELRFNLGVSYASLGRQSAASQEAAALRGLDPNLAQRLLEFMSQGPGGASRP